MEETVLIRQQASSELSVRRSHSALLPVERGWAKGEAERILRAARDNAAQLLERAAAEAENLRQAASARGAREGREKSARLLANVIQWHRREKERLRESLPRLASIMAERLFNESLRLNPEHIFSICRGVLDECPLAAPLVVKLHPQDLELLSSAGGEAARRELVRFESGGDLSRGDCLVQGGFGQVDGRLTVRIEVLRKALERLTCDGMQGE